MDLGGLTRVGVIAILLDFDMHTGLIVRVSIIVEVLLDL